jgi:hypothetical protein
MQEIDAIRSAARGRPVVEAIYLGFSRGSK